MTDELDQLLDRWAANQRLIPAQVSDLRARVLATGAEDVSLDADWLWTFLRPVTDLVERVGGGSRAQRYLAGGVDEALSFTAYLRLG